MIWLLTLGLFCEDAHGAFQKLEGCDEHTEMATGQVKPQQQPRERAGEETFNSQPRN